MLPIEVERPKNVLSRGEHLGFRWIVMHNGWGVRCGYVRVPYDHPWCGLDLEDSNVEVHGGITFSSADEPIDKREKDARWWWVGFDCGHAWDAPDPSLPSTQVNRILELFSSRWIIRSQEYVEGQCRLLCEQAVAHAHPTGTP